MLKISEVITQEFGGDTVLGGVGRLASSRVFTHARISIAYASAIGCRQLVGELSSRMTNWADLQKRWLIGIDFGRTEPEALRYLRGLPNSKVKVPNGSNTLKRRLLPVRSFHPKTYLFEEASRTTKTAVGLLLGSANLTLGGLLAGTEHVITLLSVAPFDRRERALVEAITRWWDSTWSTADTISDQFIGDYERIRPRQPFGSDDDVQLVKDFVRSDVVSLDDSAKWAKARCFWIETYGLYKNRGPSVPGNQLDCRRGTRVYFGFSPTDVARNTVFGDIRLQWKDGPAVARSVRYGNNQMDKVNLPVPGQDGPQSYDNSYLLFERIGQQRFRLSFVKGRDLTNLRKRSRKQGMYYRFAGGREYGFCL